MLLPALPLACVPINPRRLPHLTLACPYTPPPTFVPRRAPVPRFMSRHLPIVMHVLGPGPVPRMAPLLPLTRARHRSASTRAHADTAHTTIRLAHAAASHSRRSAAAPIDTFRPPCLARDISSTAAAAATTRAGRGG